ncbi:MAG: peptidylprolyl isomerase [Desulfovibrio sp.]|uniref:peptidylprolyl isomerase n=1 Tax=Desulfovibrio sp. 7SRBS1 TaxID=3378064 RepID=UPI003B3E1120
MSNPMVLLETSMGEILVELFEDKAPATVKNFLQYVDDEFYDGLIFHRVIDNFMVQGGGMDMMMKEKPTRAAIKNEASADVSNKKGTLAMARTMEVDSATAQFFINVRDNPHLDHRDETAQGFGYCVFGQVVEGIEIVDKMKKVRTKNFGFHADVPVDPITIISARRFETD